MVQFLLGDKESEYGKGEVRLLKHKLIHLWLAICLLWLIVLINALL